MTLRVFDGTGSGRTLACEGSRDTVALGAMMRVVAVTLPTAPSVARVLPEHASPTTSISVLATPVLRRRASWGRPRCPLRSPTRGVDLPRFSSPPADLGKVRLVHASCRKPHGQGLDALPGLDEMIRGTGGDASSSAFALGRPHQLFLTGDQIYADDVADALLFMLIDAADVLLGWTAPLPGTLPASYLAPSAHANLTLDAGPTSRLPPSALTRRATCSASASSAPCACCGRRPSGRPKPACRPRPPSAPRPQ